MYKKHYLTSGFFIVLLFFVNSAFAQKKPSKVFIDSLFKEIKVKPDTKLKVDDLLALYKTASKARIKNNAIIDEALKIAEKLNYADGLAKCYNRKGILARRKNDFKNSIALHKKALEHLTNTTDTLLKIKCLNSLGVSYRKLNIEKEAFDYYFQALKLSEKFKSDRSIAIALSGIGNVFLNTEEYDNALYYFKKAIGHEKNSYKGKEYDYANIGEAFLHKKEYDSAYFYFNKSLDIALEHPYRESAAIKYNLLGLLFQKKEDYEKSIAYYLKAIPQLKEFNSKRYLSNTLINIGIDQMYLHKNKEAISNINKGLEIAKKIKSKENIILGYEALVNYYVMTKDYKKALNAHKIATSFHDSILNEASQKSIISTQIAYNTAEKDKKIQELAKEKEQSQEKAKINFYSLIISIAIAVIVITIILSFFYLQRKKSDLELQNKNIELRKHLHQIKELKDKASRDVKTTNQELAERFNSFKLSKREIEVLTHIANGLSNEEIAKKMYVSKNTIKTHIKNIYLKLDVKNRIQAIKKLNNL
ncbi:tetratricopeptide repeat protein [Lutibacter sp.]